MNKEPSGVKIKTPSRLHFTLIDLNGELGRLDGGIGITLSEPNWIINIERSIKWSIPEQCTQIVQLIKKHLKPSKNYKIDLESSILDHVGLGSYTQLSLAIAHGISKFEGEERTVQDLASIVGRGSTSGIGVAAYDNGGFILDAGHSISEKSEFLPSHFSNAKPAVVLQRLNLPLDWYFVVTIPDIGQGKYGAEEIKIFKKHCPIPRGEVEKISRVILMQILPSVIEDNIEMFGKGLNEIQEFGFKGIENQLQPEIIGELRKFCLESGACGAGLSSFGPATFAVIRSKTKATELSKKIQEFLKANGHSGKIFVTTASNSGAKVEFY
jgi:beta-ribofuranosylaminobenzene 5'-phosphate synthase